jgi:lysozyme family protein
MKSNFEKSLKLVLKHEGGYVNHRADPGGPTNLGVTLATAKRLGVDVDGDGDTDIDDIKKLKPVHAALVYRNSYWNSVRGDDLPFGVDYVVFDFAVNSGVSRASKFLQRAAKVKADGVIGPVTLDAVYSLDSAKLIAVICNARRTWLRGLSTWPTFGKGWERRVAGVKKDGVALSRTIFPGRLRSDFIASVPRPRTGLLTGQPLARPHPHSAGSYGWLTALLSIIASPFKGSTR